jgi:hypothetical protein
MRAGSTSWDVMQADCPVCGAKKGFRCHLNTSTNSWGFHNERWYVAPVRRTQAIDRLGNMRSAKPKKVTSPVHLVVDKPLTGWVSAACKANHHIACTSLNCSCTCGHRF